MTTTKKEASGTPRTAAESTVSAPVIVEVGKVSKKKIKKLKKWQGPLAEAIGDTLGKLNAEGSNQNVVVIVKQKPKRSFLGI